MTIKQYHQYANNVTVDKTVSSWKQTYKVLKALGIISPLAEGYTLNNVTEYQFERYIRRLDTRRYAYDCQRETNTIEIKYLDTLIVITSLHLTILLK